MKNNKFYLIAILIGLAVTSCGEMDMNPTPLTDSGAEALLAPDNDEQGINARVNQPRNFVAQLSSENEVADPPVISSARGLANFQLSKDGSSISYKVIVANISNVSMAHIHRAPAGVNGPVVAWLYPPSAPPALIEGKFNGILAEGEITADNLVGPLAGMSLDDLLSLIQSGEAYVNVHTSQYPGGEIRGQIR